MKLRLLSRLLIFSISTFCFLATSMGQEKKPVEANQIGRYSLHVFYKGDEHVLYRLDTVTGIVSVFDPTAINSIADEDWKSLHPEIRKEAEKQISQGRFVGESPYWKKLPEKLTGVSFK